MQDSSARCVRVKAICLFLHQGRILAINGFDPTKQQRFWVPVGGQVEFGEASRDAIIREVREELSTEITDLRLLGIQENLFTFDGAPGHEIVFVYDAQFTGRQLYQTEEIQGIDNGKEFTAHWIDPFAPKDDRPLYPAGLSDLISPRAG